MRVVRGIYSHDTIASDSLSNIIYFSFAIHKADLKGKDTVLRRTTKLTGDLLDTVTSQF